MPELDSNTDGGELIIGCLSYRVSPDDRVVLGAAFGCCLFLTTALVQILDKVREKVASDLELGGCFRRVLRFPPLLTTG